MTLAEALMELADDCHLRDELVRETIESATFEAENHESEAAKVWLAAGEQAQERAAEDLITGGF